AAPFSNCAMAIGGRRRRRPARCGPEHSCGPAAVRTPALARQQRRAGLRGGAVGDHPAIIRPSGAMTLVTEMLSLARSLAAAQESEAGTTRKVFRVASNLSAI